jgi:hypothetical protein
MTTLLELGGALQRTLAIDLEERVEGFVQLLGRRN